MQLHLSVSIDRSGRLLFVLHRNGFYVISSLHVHLSVSLARSGRLLFVLHRNDSMWFRQRRFISVSHSLDLVAYCLFYTEMVSVNSSTQVYFCVSVDKSGRSLIVLHRNAFMWTRHRKFIFVSNSIHLVAHCLFYTERVVSELDTAAALVSSLFTSY